MSGIGKENPPLTGRSSVEVQSFVAADAIIVQGFLGNMGFHGQG